MAHHHSRVGAEHVDDLAPMIVAVVATLIGLMMRTMAVRYLRARQTTPTVVDQTQPLQQLEPQPELQQPVTQTVSSANGSSSSTSSSTSSSSPNIPSPATTGDNNSNNNNNISSDIPPVVPAGGTVYRLLVSNTGTGGDAVARWITLSRDRSTYTVGSLIHEAFGAQVASGHRITCLYHGIRLREEHTLDQYDGMISGATIHTIIQPPIGTPVTGTTNNTNINNNNDGTRHEVLHPVHRTIVSPQLVMLLCVLVALLGTLSGFAFVLHVNWHQPSMVLAWLTSLIAAVLVFAITATGGQRLPVATATNIHMGGNGLGVPIAFRLPVIGQHHPHPHQQ